MPLLALTHIKINGLLFDLDGTLLDTAPDLAAALNAVLTTQHRKTLSLADIRPAVSDGIAGLLKLGCNIAEQNPQFPILRKQFIDYYHQHIAHHTQLFPGIEILINYLEKNKWPWGIVTNKSSVLTKKLIHHFPLLATARCIIAGDTLTYSKPHPQPLLQACQCLHLSPVQCVYMGDAKRDIEAAHAAGMPSLVALYGYIKNKKEAATWNASAVIENPLAIIEWLAHLRQ